MSVYDDNFAIATAAMNIYTAACDGRITLDELFDVELRIGAANTDARISDEAREKIKGITANHNITWEEVKGYLDKVSVEELEVIREGLNELVEENDGIVDSEKNVLNTFDEYIASRGR